MSSVDQNYNVADYISTFLVALKCFKIHGLMGGGAAGLNDGFIRNPDIEYYCYHHEQSAGYAALGEARYTKRWAVLNPTTGCGGTNCYTPLLNAWQDSIPLVVISGNVNLNTCAAHFREEHDVQIRCYGVQEHDIISSIAPITKYSKMLTSVDEIESVMRSAFTASATGRKGPSWVDVPADLQHQTVSQELIERIPATISALLNDVAADKNALNAETITQDIVHLLTTSERPLVLLGGGIANDAEERKYVESFISERNLPVVATYAATDVVSHDYEQYLGTIGIKGNRAANFAVQNCDLLIVLGSRLPFAAIGYDVQNFARGAKIIVADVDQAELNKNEINFAGRLYQFNCHAKNFLSEIKNVKLNPLKKWTDNCKETKINWEIISENKSHFKYDGVSIYHVMEELNKTNYDNCNFVVDAGSISYVAPTSLRYNPTRNFIFSPGQADMGCALPSALGVASASAKRTICITGDGSFMSNLQELASFSYHDYKLTVIILNNSGYLSISNTQTNNYGPNRVYGEHERRGITFPNYKKMASAFGLSYARVETIEDLTLIENSDIQIVDVQCLISETIAPYQARIDGKQAGAHDMAPFRDKNELLQYCISELDFHR